MMTLRARKISVLVCALGHFEWLRMPFGLKNAPMIHQRMINNVLWGVVQPKGGSKRYAERMHEAELQSLAKRRETDEASREAATNGAAIRTKFTADHEAPRAMDPLQELVNSSDADMFSTASRTKRRWCQGSSAGARFEECRISVSITKSLFIKFKVDFLSHEVSRVGTRADPKKMQAIAALPFPTSTKGMQSFLGALNYYGRFIQHFAVYGAALYQLKDSDFDGGDLSAAKEHESTLHPVLFWGRVLTDAEINYHPAEKEVLVLLLMLKACFTTLAGKRINVYTRFSTLEWLTKSKTLFGRAVQLAVMLSPWHLVIEKVPEKDVKFAQLLQSPVTSFVDLEDSLTPVTPPSRRSATVQMDPALLYAQLQISYKGIVLSFDVVIAASAFLESTTVNIAEYTGMNQGVKAAINTNIDDLIIVGDSRLAIQQSQGVIACRKETPQTQLNHHKELTAKLCSVRYLHVVRDYNTAADSLATEALKSKTSRQVRDLERLLELQGLNRIHQVIYESLSNTVEVPDTRDSLDVVHSLRASLGLQRKLSKILVDSDCEIVSVITRRQAREPSQRTPKASRHAGKMNGVPDDTTEMNRGEQSTSDASKGNVKEPLPAPSAAPSCEDRAIPTSGDASGKPSPASGESSMTLNEQSQAPSAFDVDPVAVQGANSRSAQRRGSMEEYQGRVDR
ncbi:hypothetical protein PC128_g8942 [Phytophthora cactorum]|nr:hypothetical protein PC128_g8942 [Phytophthora cactorum]